MLKAILFTDDAIVYTSSKYLEHVVYCMTRGFDILGDCFKANKLSLNVSKKNFTLFTKINSNIISGLYWMDKTFRGKYV